MSQIISSKKIKIEYKYNNKTTQYITLLQHFNAHTTYTFLTAFFVQLRYILTRYNFITVPVTVMPSNAS